MALTSTQSSPIIEGRRFTSGTRTGTRSAADFTITLGFSPRRIKVVNLTSRAEGEWYQGANLDGGDNADGILTVAAGTRTYAALGIALTADGKGFTVDVSVASLETTDCDLYWEAEL